MKWMKKVMKDEDVCDSLDGYKRKGVACTVAEWMKCGTLRLSGHATKMYKDDFLKKV